VILKKAD